MKITHPQLDPNLNRTRKPAAAAPSRREEYDFPQVNPESPYVNTYLGKFSIPVEGEDGLHPGLLYIPRQKSPLGIWFWCLSQAVWNRIPFSKKETGSISSKSTA